MYCVQFGAGSKPAHDKECKLTQFVLSFVKLFEFGKELVVWYSEGA